ncbi:MAG: hypothetical protein ACRDTT_34585, partial [Pseudonocardiaceae bacterium]
RQLRGAVGVSLVLRNGGLRSYERRRSPPQSRPKNTSRSPSVALGASPQRHLPTAEGHLDG